MRLALTTLATLLAYYRRHPGQLAMLLVGLWVAGALWSGVQAINASARDSYARAEALFDARLDSIERHDGRPLSVDDYAALRRDGQPVSPLIEGELTLANGERLAVLGIEPLTLPAGAGLAGDGGVAGLTDFLTPPWRTRLAPDTLARLGPTAAEGSRPRLADGRRLPPLALAPALPPNTLVMDIAAAAALLERGEALDRLVVAPNRELALPAGLTRRAGDRLPAPDQLTESFHLNLTAMGLLALVVGLLIVHAALGLALEQRLDTLRTLRALGVPARTLVATLAGELLLLGLVGAALGVVSGVWLADWLLPDVAASLASLYGARVGVTLSLPWHYWLGGIGITLGGLATAGLAMLWRAARLDILALGRAQAWRGGFRRQSRRLALSGGLLWLAALALWGWLGEHPAGEGLVAGFLMVAAALLGSALLLPALLATVLATVQGGLERVSRRHALTQWALADLQLQLPRLQLSMMALLLALVANLGVGSMVGGFRLTFLDWLDQRLVADLYLRPPPAQYDEALAWLEGRPEIAALLPHREAEATLNEADGPRPVAVNGISPQPALAARWPLLETDDGREAAWRAVAEGAALINEQLARATGLAPGGRLSLSTPSGPLETPIVGVYPDYGNPRGEVVLATRLLIERFRAPPGSVGIVLADGARAETLTGALDERFGSVVGPPIDRRGIKASATTIFERTFAITRALNALTLAVAALALFTSLLAQARQRRARLAPLWALGVARRPLALLSLGQLGGLALVTALLALPLGIALSWALVAVINVAAFGWRLPLHLFPGQLLATLALAVLVALAAALLPAWRLWRTPPRALLAEFDAS